MDYATLIRTLKDERRRLEVAIATLEELAGTGTAIERSTNGVGRPVGSRISAEGRTRISEGMRLHWAKKKAAKEAANTAGEVTA